MIRGYASADQFRGPVGIAKMTGQVAVFGFLALLQLAAVLSVSIGLANLFPIPLLDGGLLLFLIIEKIKGSPVSEGALRIAQYVGLALLLTLMVFVFKNDILRLLQTYQ